MRSTTIERISARGRVGWIEQGDGIGNRFGKNGLAGMVKERPSPVGEQQARGRYAADGHWQGRAEHGGELTDLWRRLGYRILAE